MIYWAKYLIVIDMNNNGLVWARTFNGQPAFILSIFRVFLQIDGTSHWSYMVTSGIALTYVKSCLVIGIKSSRIFLKECSLIISEEFVRSVHCRGQERRRRHLTGSMDPLCGQRSWIWSCLNNFVIQNLPTFHLSSTGWPPGYGTQRLLLHYTTLHYTTLHYTTLH